MGISNVFIDADTGKNNPAWKPSAVTVLAFGQLNARQTTDSIFNDEVKYVSQRSRKHMLKVPCFAHQAIVRYSFLISSERACLSRRLGTCDATSSLIEIYLGPAIQQPPVIIPLVDKHYIVKRIHAFEFEDLQWFPKHLRNYGTDFLEAGANAFNLYENILPVLLKGMQSSGGPTIVDMGSGGGGGLVKIAGRLKKSLPDLKIILTDYYPNLAAFERTKAKHPEVFDYLEESIDARKVPSHLKGLRTQFLSFHHFRPADARAILQDAVDNRQPIGIFEAQQRNVKHLVQRLLSPLAVLLLTPFIKPFKAGRLLFTYLLPVVPLFVLWDGIVSVLRAYTAAELKGLISEVNNHALFDWEIKVAKGAAGDVLYLLGTPKEQRLTDSQQ